MAELKDLYQDTILDHYKNPRNRNKPQHSNREADALNPLCGDKFRIYLQLEDGVLRDIGFDGAGCAISIASASMMTETLKGKTEDEARSIYDTFINLLASPAEAKSDIQLPAALAVFSSVREYPVRVKCATLAWKALLAAIELNPLPVSTE
jgi:nitrogen fixation protein NifU and related proteins